MKKLYQVLLIDDDNITNYMHKIVIEDCAISEHILLSNSGDEALECLQGLNNCPELVFLDINMPAMDGFEFLQEIQKLSLPGQQEMVIVVLSTSTNPYDIQKINRLGEYEYLNKPLTNDKLMTLLHKHFPALAGIS
ncbi:MAG: response regulator [Bacteroidota bacterium]